MEDLFLAVAAKVYGSNCTGNFFFFFNIFRFHILGVNCLGRREEKRDQGKLSL